MHPIYLLFATLVLVFSIAGSQAYFQSQQNIACIEQGFQVVENSCVYPQD